MRCDMETDGGGWIVIQRRVAQGTVNFYRNWEDYENGFGDLDTEFWIGLGNIYELTNNEEVDLIISGMGARTHTRAKSTPSRFY